MPNYLAQGVESPGIAEYRQQGMQNALAMEQMGNVREDRQSQRMEQVKKQIQDDLTGVYAGALMAPTPEESFAIYAQNAAEFNKRYPSLGLPPAVSSPQELFAGLARGNPDFARKLVEAKMQPPKNESRVVGRSLVSPDGKVLYRDPEAAPAPPAPDRAVVPVADPNSPTGFVYTPRGSSAGKPAPAPRAQTSGKYSPKELQTARDKMRQLSVAKQQLADIKAAREKMRNSVSSGGLGGYLPTEAGSNFDQAVDSFRDTITAITRVPGVGAQSDFEARLSQAKLPDRTKYESSQDQAIKSLEDLVYGLESGYSDLLAEGQQPAGAAVDPQDIIDAADAILNAP